MQTMYILYIKDHFNKEWHLVRAWSQFKSELYGWLEVNWRQFQGGKVPVVEAEVYYLDKIKKGDFS